MTFPYRLSLFPVLLLLSACGGLVDLGPQGPAPQVFTLAPLPRAADQPETATRLLVEQPVLSGALDSQRIAVRRGDLELAYLAGARWEDAAPQLLRRHLAQSLDNRPGLEAVGEGNLDLPVDLRLRLDLRAFNAVTTDRVGRLRIEIAWVATLLAGDTPQILASRYFQGSRDASSDAPATIASSFNAVLNDLAEEMARWTEETARASSAAGDS